MKTVRYYGSSHPMLAKRTGDPARGAWEPASKQERKRKGRRRSR